MGIGGILFSACSVKKPIEKKVETNSSVEKFVELNTSILPFKKV